MNVLFQKAIPVLKMIQMAGYEAFFVGGSVRDLIIGREITDIDIATSATPEELKTIFPKTFDVGIQHGTVVVLFEGDMYEITTFRTESTYLNYRKPEEVQFVRSLEEDLKRRDFTMNAMAMSIDGEIIDYYNGKNDINDKIIRTVGNATERFSEDALRMLRAIRFSSQLGFNIEEDTVEAIKENNHLLGFISVERKQVEWNKLLEGSNYKRGIELLDSLDVVVQLPILESIRENLIKFIQYDTKELSLEEKWTTLFYIANVKEDDVSLFLKEWKYSTKFIHEVKRNIQWLYYRQEAEWTKYNLYRASVDTVLTVERIRNVLGLSFDNEYICRNWYEQLPIKGRDQLIVTGKDFINWMDRKQGPWLREIIEKVEEMVVEGHISNERSVIEAWVSQCYQD